jgi:hypothetical protein
LAEKQRENQNLYEKLVISPLNQKERQIETLIDRSVEEKTNILKQEILKQDNKRKEVS